MTSDTKLSIDLSAGFAGKIIVAMPHLDDTPFEESLCLICSHDDEHAFGVIVNKPMAGVSLADVVGGMDIAADDSAEAAPVFFGGPVELQRGAVVHSLDYVRDETVRITKTIGLTATRDALSAICDARRAPRQAMLVMGHAGWAGGQLENEIKRNDWLTLNATNDLVFRSSDGAWENALHHLGIRDLTQFEGNEAPVVRPN